MLPTGAIPSTGPPEHRGDPEARKRTEQACNNSAGPRAVFAADCVSDEDRAFGAVVSRASASLESADDDIPQSHFPKQRHKRESKQEHQRRERLTTGDHAESCDARLFSSDNHLCRAAEPRRL